MMRIIRVLKPPQMRCMMPMILLWSWEVIGTPFRFEVSALDGHRHGVAAAEAERGQPTARVPALHLVEHRRQKARARLPDGVPERDRAAVDVDLRRVEPELADDGDGLHREGFVQLDEVNLVERPPGLAQDLPDGLDRRSE